jgi:hypothetical protein
MNTEFAFRLLLGALSLTGCGLLFIFFLLFGDERDVDPIYRAEVTATSDCEQRLDVA